MRDLDFGAPAAERDIGRGLEQYFVESAAFDRVRSGAKTIILGNRGSGKSAIVKVLAARERAAGSHVIELAPEDYSYELSSRGPRSPCLQPVTSRSNASQLAASRSPPRPAVAPLKPSGCLAASPARLPARHPVQDPGF